MKPIHHLDLQRLPTMSVCMACHDDFDGVFFTVQSLRLYHGGVHELLILDNHPDSAHGEALRHFAKSVPNLRVIPVTDRVSSWVKYDALLHATGDVVLGLDAHVLLQPRALSALEAWWEMHAGQRDLLTGPLLYNDLHTASTHLEPQWRGHDFGTWAAHDAEALTRDEPFEIPMQGMGLWSVWRTAWPGVPRGMSGFGAEEWCMAERIRQHGGRVLCHPRAQWVHRFGRPVRSYPLTLEDKVRNYYRGWRSVYPRTDHPRMLEMTAHWETQMPSEKLQTLIKEVLH